MQEKPEEEAEKVERKPRIRGKKYKIAKAKVDKTKFYPISEAIKLIKETSYGKFDASIELHLVVKKQGLNINVSLPHSFGKAKKVEICGEKTLKKLEKGIVDFDVLLATPEMMPKLVPYAKILGPKGLMPNPKTGTLIKDKKDADKFSSGTISVKTEKKAPLIHQTIGKVSQNNKELEENMVVLIDTISAKQISKAYLSSSMSPSVKLQL
ncbi:hypothetical protein A2Z22_03695 [Candidatus Woesebacteria bacterium RBG_16_34_12]|uniref:Ribosomal protein n=1 Tax=Candidatus Woesebacteria bacterium RBG_16_34_12 TaxID=1802480 RepID=A0A1F7X8E5_9BACT|nr:MAG: hypothetical protein A2Z22_03695 [Candidatus Woesebacteria bacterium RBG_16_34_12]